MTYWLLTCDFLDIRLTGEEYTTRYLFKMEDEEAEKMMDKIYDLTSTGEMIPFTFCNEAGDEVQDFEDFADFNERLNFERMSENDFNALKRLTDDYDLDIECGGKYIISQIHKLWKANFCNKRIEDLNAFLRDYVGQVPTNNKLRIDVNGTIYPVTGFGYDHENHEIYLESIEEDE